MSDYGAIERAVLNQEAWAWAKPPGNLEALRGAFKALDAKVTGNQFSSELMISDLKTLKKNHEDPELTAQLKKVGPDIGPFLFVVTKEIKKILAIHAVQCGV